ncbi:hypothetical protein DFH06DRAFT_177399 [Mycena polygramma]|nr:hypothetical protein DFH06DRAFT_177399 [Mycena polygramma]
MLPTLHFTYWILCSQLIQIAKDDSSLFGFISLDLKCTGTFGSQDDLHWALNAGAIVNFQHSRITQIEDPTQRDPKSPCSTFAQRILSALVFPRDKVKAHFLSKNSKEIRTQRHVPVSTTAPATEIPIICGVESTRCVEVPLGTFAAPEKFPEQIVFPLGSTHSAAAPSFTQRYSVREVSHVYGALFGSRRGATGGIAARGDDALRLHLRVLQDGRWTRARTAFGPVDELTRRCATRVLPFVPPDAEVRDVGPAGRECGPILVFDVTPSETFELERRVEQASHVVDE